jgi:hypothetical protein
MSGEAAREGVSEGGRSEAGRHGGGPLEVKVQAGGGVVFGSEEKQGVRAGDGRGGGGVDEYARQYTEVQAWLTERYAPAPVPSWEISAQSIAALHRLATRNHMRDAEANARISLAREGAARHRNSLRRLQARCARVHCEHHESNTSDGQSTSEMGAHSLPQQNAGEFGARVRVYHASPQPATLSHSGASRRGGSTADHRGEDHETRGRGEDKKAGEGQPMAGLAFSTEALSRSGRNSSRALASLAVRLELDSPNQTG